MEHLGQLFCGRQVRLMLLLLLLLLPQGHGCIVGDDDSTAWLRIQQPLGRGFSAVLTHAKTFSSAGNAKD